MKLYIVSFVFHDADIYPSPPPVPEIFVDLSKARECALEEMNAHNSDYNDDEERFCYKRSDDDMQNGRMLFARTNDKTREIWIFSRNVKITK